MAHAIVDLSRQPAIQHLRWSFEWSLQHMVDKLLTAQSSNFVSPREAIARFLADMQACSNTTFEAWGPRLADGVAECLGGNHEAAKHLLDPIPIQDLYFAGLVGMESARIRRYFSPDVASALLAELAAQVDQFSGRPDRLTSDFAFFVIGRIDLETGVERMRMPYDLVVSMLLDRIGIAARESTLPLMSDIVFRHNLGEPIARGMPAWWKSFSERFSIISDDAGPPTPIVRTA